MNAIYYDHAASTPMHPDVVEAMLPYMRASFGNASSMHAFGRAAKVAINDARDSIASLLKCAPGELLFTGGGTESDNTALFGAASAYRGVKNHIVTTTVEHHAVLHACAELERQGFEVTYVPVDSTGQVSAADIEAAIRPDTFLISVMYGNNEVGTLQPIERIGAIARERGVLLHVDAVQALGSVPLDLHAMPVDLLSLSAHKINGPQGVGALYVRRGIKIDPLLFGGSQERKRRAGTENVAGIAGFAKAVRLAYLNLSEKKQNSELIRQTLIERLHTRLGDGQVVINGHPTERFSHILNVSFPGLDTETMLMNLDMAGIASASGSACTSGSLEPSHVLQAMGLSEERIRSAVRFSFGLGNTVDEALTAAQIIATIVERLRNTNGGLS